MLRALLCAAALWATVPAALAQGVFVPPGGQVPAFGQPAPVQAQAPNLKGFDRTVVEMGMKYYRPPDGDCEPCHGYAGGGALALDTYTGRGTAPGPSLVTSKLDRAAMIELVACGSTGNETLPMPAYLPAAWTKEHPCHGKIAADIVSASSGVMRPSVQTSRTSLS